MAVNTINSMYVLCHIYICVLLMCTNTKYNKYYPYMCIKSCAFICIQIFILNMAVNINSMNVLKSHKHMCTSYVYNIKHKM